MRKTILSALVLVATVLSLDMAAQDAGPVIDAATKAMGVATLNSVQFSGTGTTNPVGQAATAGGPWPRFRVTKYVASVNYTAPAMRQEIVRVDDERPPRGGGAGAFNPATGQGGIRPIPGDIIQNQVIDARTEVGALTIWLMPHGFLKGAAANRTTAKAASARGKTLVSFTAFGKYTVTGTINAQNLVDRVETRMDNTFTGDTLVEAIYSNYKDFAGVKFPQHILQRQGGHPVLEIAVADVQPNSPAALEVVAPPQRGGREGGRGAAGPAAAQVRPEKIAEGVWFLTLGNPQSLLIEFADHVVVFEGPTGDDRSMATIAEVKRMLPNKPIRFLVNTHHHADHSGGIRAYVAEGIPIITHETHKRYYEQEIFRSPHTINPDRLARMPRAAMIETVRDKRVLTDGRMTLELHHLRGNLHAEGLLVGYVPAARLLIQADAFAPRPGAAPLSSPSPYTTNLVDNVERLKVDVERVAHVHGGVDPYTAVLQAAGRSTRE